MMKLNIILAFLLCISQDVLSTNKGLAETIHKDLTKIFAEDDIVPDVIDLAPQQILQLSWDHANEADLGNELKPIQVRNQPFAHWVAEAGKFYTIAMVDPDEFNRKEHTQREFVHWLVVNIPGTDLDKGEVIASYIGSGPPKDGGLHRYVLLVFQQIEKQKFEQRKLPAKVKDRVKFSIREFAKLNKLGNPLAGNFYIAKWDESVPDLLARLTK